MQYNPFVHFNPFAAASYNYTIPRLRRVVSSPSQHLESTSLVLSLGLDVQFTRVTPSKAFDMLSSEFNKSLLTLILSVMFVIVVVLRNINRKKILARAWN
jgi:hypothetical protein